jgi:hypothetical protein
MMRERHPFDLDVCAKCETTFRRPTPEMVGSLAIKPALKVVYRVEIGGKAKHFLKRSSAYQRYAWKRLAEKYKCDGSCDVGPVSHEDPINEGRCYRGVCHPWRTNDDYGYRRNPSKRSVEFLQRRFVRWLLWHDKETRKRGRSPMRVST